jgi:uncharacterized protein YcaQ
MCRRTAPVHPRQVEQHFAHGRMRNYWGGSSNASTQLLDDMHYRGMLRVVRRDSGTRVYEAVAHAPADDSPAGRAQRAAALIELVVRKYAPLPAASLTYLVRLLGYGAPHLSAQTQAALRIAREELASCRIDGTTWYWPADENPASRRHAPDDAVRLLAPFDPVVWDRRRFELLWGWTYKFEAYTPAPKRQFGYYALPMLRHDRVIGWANVTAPGGRLQPAFGYDGKKPRDAAFRAALDDELHRMTQFLAARASTAAGAARRASAQNPRAGEGLARGRQPGGTAAPRIAPSPGSPDGKRSQGGAKLPTGGDGSESCTSPRAPGACNRFRGQQISVRFRSRRSQSG